MPMVSKGRAKNLEDEKENHIDVHSDAGATAAHKRKKQQQQESQALQTKQAQKQAMQQQQQQQPKAAGTEERSVRRGVEGTNRRPRKGSKNNLRDGTGVGPDHQFAKAEYWLDAFDSRFDAAMKKFESVENH